MVAVRLTRMWFAPGGIRYRPGMYNDMPDQLVEHLPSSATVSDGKHMIPVSDFLGKAKGKRYADKTEIADFSPNTNASPEAGRELAPDRGAPSKQMPANTEGVGVSSPKSSGPETQALPGDNAKTGEAVTASGTTAGDKATEKAADNVKKSGKIDL